MARTPAPIDPELIGRVRTERLPVHDIEALVGVGRVRAKRIRDTAGIPPWPEGGYIELPLWPAPTAGDVVDIVPSGEGVAQPMFLAGDAGDGTVSMYLRGHSRTQPLWRSATYMGTDIGKHVQVRPIIGRALISDGTIRPHFAEKDLNKRVKKTWKPQGDFIAGHWEGPADVVILGDRLPDIDLPLGWEGGIPGVRHVFLEDLRNATVFKGVPTAKI